ncbi:MAG: hypothetical protein IBX69_14670 [Anaerolineales bacterium]|nr:hypothetical protein [Anaerolineales bacterium]
MPSATGSHSGSRGGSGGGSSWAIATGGASSRAISMKAATLSSLFAILVNSKNMGVSRAGSVFGSSMANL